MDFGEIVSGYYGFGKYWVLVMALGVYRHRFNSPNSQPIVQRYQGLSIEMI